MSALLILLIVGIAGLFVATKRWASLRAYLMPEASKNDGSSTAATEAATAPAEPTVEVAEKGLHLLKIGTVGERDFEQVIRDVGVVDFNQDMTVPAFPSYQGKIIKPMVDLGDRVEKDQVLYTIYSPDLLQAESTLIQTAGVLELATRNLGRLRQSVRNGGGAQKDLEQAVSDQQTAVGAYASAKLAMAVFGKTDAEADRIAATRTVDPVLEVKSPFTGVITARNAAPGDLVQPGTAPAPYTVAALGKVRLYDFVSEDDSPKVKVGQTMTGQFSAYPGRVFSGTVTAIAAMVDPNTHRVQVESLIPDPGHLLLPSMFGDLTIRTGPPLRSPSVPTAAVVRLGDGTMTAWATSDDRHFTQRVIRIGLQQDGFDQVLQGLRRGERIVTDGTVYVSNIANANASP